MPHTYIPASGPAAQDLQAATTADGARDMVSLNTLTGIVAKLCGGEHCEVVDGRSGSVTLEQLKNLIYRRYPLQMFSAAPIIAAAIDGRPPAPPKRVDQMSVATSRLLSHFKVVATNTQLFFAAPMSMFSAEDGGDRPVQFHPARSGTR